MSEELSAKNLTEVGLQIGYYEFYNIGNTTLNTLKKYKIIPHIDYGAYNTKKPDALLVDRRNKSNIEVIAVIEHKDGLKFRSDADRANAIEQCNDLAQVLKSKIGIATDGSDFIWINPLHSDSNNDYQDSHGKKRSYSIIKDEQKQKLQRPFTISQLSPEQDIEKLDDDTKETLLLIEKIISSISDTNSEIKPESTNDPTPLAKQIWQDVWSISGATPENCLYTFVELFIFKYLSDLKILDKDESGNTIGFDDIYSLGSKYAFPNYIKNVRPYLRNLFPPEKPLEQGGTTIINGTVLTGGVEGHDQVFYRILQRFAKFGTLTNIDPNFKSHLFETFLKESISKKNWGQFFTPRKVVRAIVAMSGIENAPSNAKVCDPFCGVGGFILEPLLKQRRNDFYVKNGSIEQKLRYFGYDKGFDKEEQKTIILAKANMLIFLSDLIRKHKPLAKKFADIFNNTFRLRTKSILGILDMIYKNAEYTGPYDLILTNPPYVTSGSKNLKDAIKARGELYKFYQINGMGVESLALEWIIRNLSSNGKAFVIIPAGILNRLHGDNLRQFILDECFIDCIISLPKNTFYSTPTKTYILGITKKSDKSQLQTDPVFTYFASTIGETLDVYRFNIEDNDLDEAKNLFNQFKGAKTQFQTKDKRCKIQPIRKFMDDVKKHWSVDRWWTRDEKIELKIEDEEDLVTPEEYVDFLKSKSEEFLVLLSKAETALKKNAIVNEQQLRPVQLSDKEYFNLSIGKRVLIERLFADKNLNHKVPTYSANVLKIFGYLEKSNIKNFSHPYVLWGIDWKFNLRIMQKGEIFATTDHCGSIEILSEAILPEYVALAIERKKLELGFDRSLRANLQNMGILVIDIPINAKGEFDLSAQQGIIDFLRPYIDIRSRILTIKKEIEDKAIMIEPEYDFIEEPITEMFSIRQGNAFYTKKRIFENNWLGGIPVYSSNTTNNGFLTGINLKQIRKNELYYQYCLTWSIDGYAGKLFVRNEANSKNEKRKEFYFTINNHCGIMIPKKGNIHLPFLKYVLQPIYYERAKGYGNGKVGTNQIEDIFVKVPITKDNNYDLQKQIDIAQKYEVLENVKSSLMEQLENMGSYTVSISPN